MRRDRSREQAEGLKCTGAIRGDSAGQNPAGGAPAPGAAAGPGGRARDANGAAAAAGGEAEVWDKHFCSLFGEEEDALASHEGEALPSPAVSEEGRTATAATQPRERLSSPHAPRPQTFSEKKRLGEAPRVAVGAQQEPREAAAIPWAQGEGHRPGERPGGAGTERRARRGGGSVRPPRCSPSQLGLFPSHGAVGSSRCWKRRGAEGVPRWPGGSCGVPLKAAGTGASQGKEKKRTLLPHPYKIFPFAKLLGSFPSRSQPGSPPLSPPRQRESVLPPQGPVCCPKTGWLFFSGAPARPAAALLA